MVLSFKNVAEPQIVLLQIFKICINANWYLIVYNFTRLRYSEKHTPQDHCRCVILCYLTRMPQKTRPGEVSLKLFMFLFFA